MNMYCQMSCYIVAANGHRLRVAVRAHTVAGRCFQLMLHVLSHNMSHVTMLLHPGNFYVWLYMPTLSQVGYSTIRPEAMPLHVLSHNMLHCC